jgi:SAM-dependent methyltransferase
VSELREKEAESIRAFVQLAADDGFLSGRVLDYGCGKQPYRDIVEAAGGHYEGYDEADFPGNVSEEDIGGDLFWDANAWDAILCTQVVQYVPDPLEDLLKVIYGRLFSGGVLVLTYPTNWPEVEPVDLHRFTKLGMTRLVEEAGFEIIRHDWRHGFYYAGLPFTVGYGVIARA